MRILNHPAVDATFALIFLKYAASVLPIILYGGPGPLYGMMFPIFIFVSVGLGRIFCAALGFAIVADPALSKKGTQSNPGHIAPLAMSSDHQ